MFALIFYYAPKFARRDLSFGLSHKIVFALFVLASTISYARGIAVYQVEHRNNEWLSDAYPPDGRPTDFDIMAFPDVNYVRRVKQDLLRLGIGPYRSLGRPSAAVYSGAFREAVPLLPGTVITQRFHAAYPRIRFISFVTLTWGNTPSPYLIHWSIVGLNGETRTLIGEGAIKSSDWLDWRTAIINVPSAPEQQSFEVTFSVDKSAVVENYVGVGLYPTSADPFSPAEINGIARPDGSKVGLRVGYQ
jgi:hypothetical protein